MSADDWRALDASPSGVFLSRQAAARRDVRAGDTITLNQFPGARADGSSFWPFNVLGFIADPPGWSQQDDSAIIVANIRYFRNTGRPDERDIVSNFRVAIDRPEHAAAVCHEIQRWFTNATPALTCVPARQNSVQQQDANVNMRQISLGIGAAGLFMILFVCANGIAESVRERLPQFGILRAIGFGNGAIAKLVILEAAVPPLLAALVGSAAAPIVGQFLSRLASEGLIDIPEMRVTALATHMGGDSWSTDCATQRCGATIPATAHRYCLDDSYALRSLRQIAALFVIAVGGLRERYASAIVIVIGMACVVGVLTSMLSLTAGLMSAYLRPGDARRAIVWEKNADFDQYHGLVPDDIAWIRGTPGIAKGPDGAPMADGEYMMWVPLEGFSPGSLQLRGIGPAGVALRPCFRIVAGHPVRAGMRELIVGLGAARKFGLGIGSQVRLRDGNWPIVGVFSCGADIIESYLLGDAVTVMAARRRSGYAQVFVQLVDAEAYPAFKRALESDPAIPLSVERKTEYDRRIVGSATAFFTRMSYIIVLIIALGSLFGVVKIMYGSCARARTRSERCARSASVQRPLLRRLSSRRSCWV